MSKLESITEDAIRGLTGDYEKNRYRYLTEGDVVASLACRLRSELPPESVHTELRPFKGEQEISAKEKKWSDVPRGCTVDLAVMNKRMLRKQVKEKAVKCWRHVRFPVEAFRAAIEVKIRLLGNEKNIKKDVDKLREIRNGNRNCLVYMVLMDRMTEEEDVQGIRQYAESKNVAFFTHEDC